MGQRKGIIEMQFNWALILILGGAMLILAITISSREKSISETSASVSLANSLHNILSNNALGYESESASSIIPKKSKITFECNRYIVEDASRNIKDFILFSPGAIDSDGILIDKLGWDFPYPAGNFLYLTSSFPLMINSSSKSRFPIFLTVKISPFKLISRFLTSLIVNNSC